MTADEAHERQRGPGCHTWLRPRVSCPRFALSRFALTAHNN